MFPNPPALGSGKGLGIDSGDLVPREEPSESEHISSWRGDLLVGFFFFFLKFSCLGCLRYSVASSVTVQRWEELLESTSSLERDRGEAEGCPDLTAPGCLQKSPAQLCGGLSLRFGQSLRCWTL